jgi:hypothetical protein
MLVVVPSRGRPQNIERLIMNWVVTDAQATLLVAVDDDDSDLEDYIEIMSKAPNHEQYQLFVGRRLRLAGTLNHIVMERVLREGTLGSDIIGFMGDDHVPRTLHWDSAIDYTFATHGLGIVYGNDLIQGPNLPTAVFMSAAIIHSLGYMVPPGLTHMYLDNTWKVWGEGMGRLTYLQNVIIEHMHPIAGKAEWDDRYVEVNAGHQYASDEAAYKNYLASRVTYDLNKLRSLVHG